MSRFLVLHTSLVWVRIHENSYNCGFKSNLAPLCIVFMVNFQLTMTSTFQSFVKFILTFVIVNVTLLVLRHQQHHLVRTVPQSQQLIMDQRTNGTKSFEAIVSEYKRVVRLKSADASKSISQFEKLVEKYKQSASKDLLNQIYQKVEKVEKPKGMTVSKLGN